MGISERKEREKLRRRNDIIDAAEKVFFEKSFEQATMDDVAQQAELSKGTLYLYFRNKEELQYAIKMRATIQLKEMFLDAVDQNTPGYRMIEQIGRTFIRFSQEHQQYFVSMMEFEGKDLEHLNLDDPFIAEFIEQHSPMYFFIDAVKKGQQDGSIRDDIPPHVIAHNLWGMTTGVLQLISNQKTVIEKHGYSSEPAQYIEGMFKMYKSGLNNQL
jgi:AcrR family transcriptional regulator